jgi:MFS transporter, AAHS family, vanillate permease
MSQQLKQTDLAAALERQTMTPFQIAAVGVCTILNGIDGFDVLAISFAAPVLAEDWALPAGKLGILFSSGLAGMTVGSLLIAPLADQIGRRWMTLGSLIGVTLGMFLSAAAQSPLQLALTRVLTGLGIGAMLPSLATVVAEYSSARRRELSISVMSTGYPIGATVGGIGAVFLVSNLGWRGIFVLGGLLSLTMIPIVIWRLPESLAFLATRRPRGALERINLLLRRVGREELVQLPEPRASRARARTRDVVRGRLGAHSAALWSAFFCVMLSFYFVLSWTPKLLVDAGLKAEQGISGGVLLNLGGIAGALGLGLLAARVGPFRIVALTMGAGAVSVALFGLFAHGLALAMTLALVVGYLIFGSLVGLYSIMPSVYPAEVRNTGAGLSVGIGRVGAIASPYVAGLLLEGKWSGSSIYVVFAMPLLAAGAATLLLGRLRSSSAA